MEKGYYSLTNIDEALFGLVSQKNSNIDGMVFLHGVCGIFALALHDIFNYDIGWILDDDESNLDDDESNEESNPWHHLVHVFCHYKTLDDSVVYVDIRGSQSDADKFEDPFEDFFIEPQYEFCLSHEDVMNNIFMDMSAEEFSDFYDAAVQFINQNKDAYSL